MSEFTENMHHKVAVSVQNNVLIYKTMYGRSSHEVSVSLLRLGSYGHLMRDHCMKAIVPKASYLRQTNLICSVNSYRRSAEDGRLFT